MKEKPWPRKDKGCLLLLTIFLYMGGLGLVSVVLGIHRHNRMIKQSEAKNNLSSLYTAQVVYFGEYGTYAGGPHCFDLLEWRPEGDTKYTYWCDRDFIGPTKKGAQHWHCVNVKAVTSINAFTVCAAGNIDEEENIIDTWSMRDAKNLRNDQNDVGLD